MMPAMELRYTKDSSQYPGFVVKVGVLQKHVDSENSQCRYNYLLWHTDKQADNNTRSTFQYLVKRMPLLPIQKIESFGAVVNRVEWPEDQVFMT
ncbi:hypothetical protein GCM10023184_38640 [Flaviaesturariibacter amylovorans]|uniref:START domain-containing protein n=1 Tax=Flaviaesturariibacter amylovorans TaxID=1084520 RepID=A0ABP8HKZ1_9BACT